ncbi:RsfA family transcriptional regulator [Aciduricibacillus chroicocephali]|uniref:RsfA family transcriptional regulator n=1 Tax=Aciduricibacillus chroicocephali TaxID=3054939 RepID=A0ABY9L1C7_9BACI|nr:RsfA family transcriptional regulator [Bacillaceae bacterium 44XB]
MNGSRQDAWTTSEDRILADTVLRYIREGGTQLDAFKEVGEKLKRTPAACGFRWNANIRKAHEKQIAEAKRLRKGLLQKVEEEVLPSKDALDHAIMLLENLRNDGKENEEEDYKMLFVKLKEENIQLEQLIGQYEDILKQMLQLLHQAQKAGREVLPFERDKGY